MKLKAPSKRIRALGSRLAVSTGQSRDGARNKAQPWRAWYMTRRWRRLRISALERDLWTCRQTGVLLTSGRVNWNAAVVDHIIPHRGDPELFWDFDNLQSVSKEWHDSVKNAQDRRYIP